MVNTKFTTLMVFAFALMAMILLPTVAQDQSDKNAATNLLIEHSEAIRKAIDAVKASIVEIRVDRYAEESKYSDYANYWFRKIRENKNPQFSQRPKAPVTGFVISADGFIATSAFNVSGRISGITVKLADGREMPARISAFEKNHDLAILQVDADDLTVPEFNDDDVKKNEALAAVSVNAGNGVYFDSATLTGNMKINTDYYVLNVNANFGNSGAAVINQKGEIIGMLNLISYKSCYELNHGIGFCLPISTLIEDAESLKQGLTKELKETQYLGVSFDESKYKDNKMIITNVFSNTGAEFSGLQKGDELNRINGVLIKVDVKEKDGKKIVTPIEEFLAQQLERYDIGKEIEVTIIRGNQVIVKNVMLIEKWLNIGY